MRPISKRLLIHTATLYQRVNVDKWGKGELNGGQELSNIRIEPSIATCNGDNEATNTRFLGAEIWQGHIYQYFAQKLSCSVRINYRIVYTYL